MSRQTDQVIDDDESETCPLCIEEFDLSDYNFYPCPCGYQICQFCYNNIKTTMNGLCPACRRQYDDKNIRWKQITQEEIKSHQENVAQQAKKKAALRQKEAAKREADSLSRKHLAGIRVRQKNLVYITGMKPTSSTDALSETLRRDEYFGQYGKIIKVVVSKAKDSTNPSAPVGVYVTFELKDSAAKCIQAVDGSQNYDTRLRAQYGTTKYCSAYLRGDTCSNKGCMFLHEPGDENESFSRQDLSSMNVISTQSPAQANMPSSGQPLQPQPPSQQAPQSIAAASPALDRRGSRDDSSSQADSTDGSGLPTSSTWGNKAVPSRQSSQHVASPSPLSTTAVLPSQAKTAIIEESPESSPESAVAELPQAQESARKVEQITARKPAKYRNPPSALSNLRRQLATDDFKFVFDDSSVDEYERKIMKLLPPLFDPYGAARRKMTRKYEVEQTIRENDSQVATQALSAISVPEQDESAGAGSLQLGGEPEENADLRQRQSVIRPPSLENITSPVFGMERTLSPGVSNSNAPTNPRSLSAQQQQHMLLQSLQSGSPAQSAQIGASGAGHARQASRYSFANDTTASASVKSVANPSLMNQQNSMMPSAAHNNQYNISQYPSGGQHFSSGVQGPPPGLKATGTPPVSGGGMFGQGHGFATAGLNYGIDPADRNTNSDKMRSLLRNRQGSVGSGQTSDASRREFTTPSFSEQSCRSRERGTPQRLSRGQKLANTSAFVDGTVDLMDSSILQARMHQNSAAGQGSYGAQGQGQDQNDIQSATAAADNEPTSVRVSGAVNSSGASTRISTPVLPPGLQIPLARQQFDGQDSSTGPPSPKPEMTSMPELGRVPTGPKSTIPTAAPTLAFASTVAPQPSRTVVAAAAGPSSGLKSEAFQQIPVDAAPIKERPLATASKAPAQPSDEDSFPALPKSRPAAPKPSDSLPSISSKPTIVGKVDKKASTKDQKRKATPSKSVDVEVKDEAAVEKPVKAADEPKPQQPFRAQAPPAAGTVEPTPQDSFKSTTPPLQRTGGPLKATKDSAEKLVDKRSEPPAITVDTSTARTTKPRTLRVLPDSTINKSITTPAPASSSSTNQSPAPTSKPVASKPVRQRTRQSSIASTTVPETLASERMDDDMSITTESHTVSRASSPPPSSKGGPANTRMKSSSQQKRVRLERLRLERANTESEPSPAIDDIVHEPIIGRKKKTKKPASTPVLHVSRIDSPKEKQCKDTEKSPTVEKPPSPEPLPPSVPKTQEPTPPIASPAPPEEVDDAFKKASSVAQATIESLQSSGELSEATLRFFRTAPNFASPKSNESTIDPEAQPSLTIEELEILDTGQAVRRNAGEVRTKSGPTSTVNRLLVTPRSRLCFHGLDPEMEDRLLKLEDRIHASQPPEKFTNRPTNSSVTAASRLVDELLQDIAAALIDPAVQHQLDNKPSRDGHAGHRAASPSKPPAYADDALAYLNQFILPMPASRSSASVEAKAYAPTGASYNEVAETDPPAISNAIPRTYTTGDPTYSVAGVDVSTSATTPVSAHPQTLPSTTSPNIGSGSRGTPASAQTLPGQAWADNLPAGIKQLSPLFEMGDMPPNMKFDDLIGGKAARDALAASLGAASNTLASVASAAAAAASNSPSANKPVFGPEAAAAAIATASKDPGGWKRVLSNDRNGVPAGVGWQEYVGEMNLPQDMIDMGADAIRQAIEASGITGGAELDVRGPASLGPNALKGLPEGAEVVYASRVKANPVAQSAGRGAAGASIASSTSQLARGGTKKEQQSRQFDTVDWGEATAQALADIEAALTAGRREVEALEKRMAGAVKRNRKVVGL